MKVRELIELLRALPDQELDVQCPDYDGDQCSISEVKIERTDDQRCKCGHNPPRHTRGNIPAWDGTPKACLDCECEQYVRNERMQVVIR